MLGPGRDDDYISVGADRYPIVGFDGGRAHELQAITQIEHLSDGSGPIDVEERKVPGDSPIEGRERDGGSDIARTDDGQMVQSFSPINQSREPDTNLCR